MGDTNGKPVIPPAVVSVRLSPIQLVVVTHLDLASHCLQGIVEALAVQYRQEEAAAVVAKAIGDLIKYKQHFLAEASQRVQLVGAGEFPKAKS